MVLSQADIISEDNQLQQYVFEWALGFVVQKNGLSVQSSVNLSVPTTNYVSANTCADDRWIICMG